MGRPRHSPPDADRIMVRLNPGTANRLRVLAAVRKVSVSVLIEESLDSFLDGAERKAMKEHPKAERPMAGPPPIWTGENLKRCLAQVGLPVATLAKELGVLPSLVSLWLGKRGIPVNRQAEITEAVKRLGGKVPKGHSRT